MIKKRNERRQRDTANAESQKENIVTFPMYKLLLMNGYECTLYVLSMRSCTKRTFLYIHLVTFGIETWI